MIMTRTILTTFAVAIAWISPAVAQHRPVLELDVAGVRLGATPAQARAGLLRAGYRIKSTSTIQSFDQNVRREAARRQGRMIAWPKDEGTFSITATGPHQENASVEFEQTPSGSRARNVWVQIPKEAITTDALRQQLLSKYGAPDAARNQGLSMTWCSAEVVRVCGVTFVGRGPRDDFYPLLTAGLAGGGGMLRLQIGEEAVKQAERDREAAVLRLAPKTDKAAF